MNIELLKSLVGKISKGARVVLDGPNDQTLVAISTGKIDHPFDIYEPSCDGFIDPNCPVHVGRGENSGKSCCHKCYKAYTSAGFIRMRNRVH